MARCNSCWLDYDESVSAVCPICDTQCAKCGTMYSTRMLEMCPECRANETGQMEFPRWFQAVAEEQNRKARRNRWILGLVIGAVILLVVIALA